MGLRVLHHLESLSIRVDFTSKRSRGVLLAREDRAASRTRYEPLTAVLNSGTSLRHVNLVLTGCLRHP